MAIANAWRGKPWNEIEILTGKRMKPSPGKNKTILIGRCMVQANKNNTDIKELIAVKGCPPNLKEAMKALHQAGIDVSPTFFENMDMAAGFFMKRFEGKPGFEESFYQIV
jgi:hypothetical protein